MNTLRGTLTNTQEGRGAVGFKGETGMSAYELAVKNGYQGTEQEWIDHFGLDLTDYIKTSEVFDMIYPVGSVYISVNNTSPSSLFGGTWEQIEDTFLLSAGDTYTAGDTGGEATHTLTTTEMPSHSHNAYLKAPFAIQTNGGTEFAALYNTGTSSNAYITNTGGGQAHNNMPPYLVVYVWKRTA